MAIRLAYLEHTQLDDIAKQLEHDPTSLRRFLLDNRNRPRPRMNSHLFRGRDLFYYDACGHYLSEPVSPTELVVGH